MKYIIINYWKFSGNYHLHAEINILRINFELIFSQLPGVGPPSSPTQWSHDQAIVLKYSILPRRNDVCQWGHKRVDEEEKEDEQNTGRSERNEKREQRNRRILVAGKSNWRARILRLVFATASRSMRFLDEWATLGFHVWANALFIKCHLTSHFHGTPSLMVIVWESGNRLNCSFSHSFWDLFLHSCTPGGLQLWGPRWDSVH